MAINLGSIMGRVKAYERSPQGRARIKECIEKYRSKGVNKTAAGSKIITEKEMLDAALKLVSVLRSTAQSHALPASIIKHFDSIQCSSIQVMPDGSSTIYIYFGGDLHRNSLYEEGYDGVDNIIALLNNGYHAKDYVYGYWDNHPATGECALDLRNTSSDAYIRSRKDREGLNFIGQAIQDFNSTYGTEYNVMAVAGDDYT